MRKVVDTPLPVTMVGSYPRPLFTRGRRIVAAGYSPGTNFSLPSPRFVLEEIQLLGSRYVRLDELQRAVALVSEGRVKTVVYRIEPLEATNEALEALEAGNAVGRVVLDVGGMS